MNEELVEWTLLCEQNYLNKCLGLGVKKKIFQQYSTEYGRIDFAHKLKSALKENLFVAQVIDKNKQLKNIVIGVAFGVKNDVTTNWQPNNVDFIFRIANRNQWAIGIFKQDMRDLIKKIEGKTSFPTVYKLTKNNEVLPQLF
jgi:hypothetical protein